MTLLEDRPEAGEVAVAPDAPAGAVVASADQVAAPVSVVLVGLSTFFAVAAAGWMCAGVFRGFLPRLVALLGAAIGVGVSTASHRTRRPAIVQSLAVPVAVVVGAILVLPFAKGGSANLPSLVIEAVRGGGIAQPPIAFDPGWRFILVVLVAVLGAAASSLAAGLDRPKIGMLLAGPLLFAAALIQPPGASFSSSAVALALFVVAFGVSYGADLARDGATSGEFELRRMGRAAAVLLALGVALAALSQAGFLFPDPTDQQVIPPKRPEPPPPQPDRVLFSFTAPRLVPLHLGVLDGYRDVAWLTPPFDAKRLQKVKAPGRLLPGGAPGEVPAVKEGSGEELLSVTVTVDDVQGHVLPSIANPQRLDARGFAVEYDPRTQDLRLPDTRATKGMTYTIEARVPPTGKELAAAPAPSPLVKEYLQVPPAPPAVQAILDAAPTAPAASTFDRLQYVRAQYYLQVVAAGAGDPIDVPPARVAQMLAGKEATPYEITAGEVLLARWAGVPARLGYGYYGGEAAGEGRWEVRPKHGATWLEAYFEGYGWVPIIGTPPRAKASLNPSQKNENPAVRPTEDLALLVYVPIRLTTIQQLYVFIRYWALRAVPWILGLILVLGFYPGAVKAMRRQRRRRWALRFGLPERVAVAYAEMRDGAYDLNIGDPTMTPLRFLDAVAADPQHTELAWLVTRALWGDLARDLDPSDAEAAEDLSRSVLRRLRRASPAVNRIVAFGSRASLRDPCTSDIPNLWPSSAPRLRLRDIRRVTLRRLSPRRLALRTAPGAAAVLVLAFALSSCGGGPSASAGRGTGLPKAIVPSESLGLTFQREEGAEEAYDKVGDVALVSRGLVYSIHQGADIQGSLQVAPFKPDLAGRKREVREGVLKGIATGRFELIRLGSERVYRLRLAEQSIYVWFPPDGRWFELMVARQGFAQAEQLFVNLLAFQRGAAAPVADVARQQPVDPRRTVRD
jgi:hypothetical protein